MSRFIYKTVYLLALFMLGNTAMGQLSHQGYAVNYGGGTITGTNLSSEVSTSFLGGKPKSENYGAYLGFASYNLNSAIVSVNTLAGGAPIADEVTGVLLHVLPTGFYDTTDVVTNASSNFNFNAVFEGDYLVNIDADPTKYVATYYGDAFLWEEAEVITLTEDVSVEINITEVPPERNETTGDGLVKGTIEEDLTEAGSEEGRVYARRRAAKRKCGLRRRTRSGRTDQNDVYELIAYGETNDNGEFEYGFLPQGTYRFFVEYPGIPLDESSFVQFDVGEAGVSDNEFVLAAVVTENGIVVELVLGITSDFFTDFQIYPNPTSQFLKISYDKVLSPSVSYTLIDLNGNKLMSGNILKQRDGLIEIDIRDYKSGIYLLQIGDTNSSKTNLTFRIIKQ